MVGAMGPLGARAWRSERRSEAADSVDALLLSVGWMEVVV